MHGMVPIDLHAHQVHVKLSIIVNGVRFEITLTVCRSVPDEETNTRICCSRNLNLHKKITGQKRDEYSFVDFLILMLFNGTEKKDGFAGLLNFP